MYKQEELEDEEEIDEQNREEVMGSNPLITKEWNRKRKKALKK